MHRRVNWMRKEEILSERLVEAQATLPEKGSSLMCEASGLSFSVRINGPHRVLGCGQVASCSPCCNLLPFFMFCARSPTHPSMQHCRIPLWLHGHVELPSISFCSQRVPSLSPLAIVRNVVGGAEMSRKCVSLPPKCCGPPWAWDTVRRNDERVVRRMVSPSPVLSIFRTEDWSSLSPVVLCDAEID